MVPLYFCMALLASRIFMSRDWSYVMQFSPGETNSYSERGACTQQRYLPLDSDVVELK